jgi:uridine kinase
MSLFDLTDVISAINNSSALCGNSRIVTIDGPAGSGKTTLANEIATLTLDLQCLVIYLPQ